MYISSCRWSFNYILGYLGSSPVVLYLLTNTHCRTSQVSRDTWDPPQLSYTYSPTLTVGHPKYPGIPGILPSCPIPTHRHSLSSIPGYLGCSPVVLYLLTNTHCRMSQVSRDTWDPPQLSYTYSPTLTVGYPKYPGIPGTLLGELYVAESKAQVYGFLHALISKNNKQLSTLRKYILCNRECVTGGG